MIFGSRRPNCQATLKAPEEKVSRGTNQVPTLQHPGAGSGRRSGGRCRARLDVGRATARTAGSAASCAALRRRRNPGGVFVGCAAGPSVAVRPRREASRPPRGRRDVPGHQPGRLAAGGSGSGKAGMAGLGTGRQVSFTFPQAAAGIPGRTITGGTTTAASGYRPAITTGVPSAAAPARPTSSRERAAQAGSSSGRSWSGGTLLLPDRCLALWHFIGLMIKETVRVCPVCVERAIVGYSPVRW